MKEKEQTIEQLVSLLPSLSSPLFAEDASRSPVFLLIVMSRTINGSSEALLADVEKQTQD